MVLPRKVSLSVVPGSRECEPIVRGDGISWSVTIESDSPALLCGAISKSSGDKHGTSVGLLLADREMGRHGWTGGDNRTLEGSDTSACPRALLVPCSHWGLAPRGTEFGVTDT